MWKYNLNIPAAVCVFMMTVAVPTATALLYVDPNGSADFTSIQAALDAASSGYIEVAPGRYNETIDFLGKMLRLYSSGGPDVTIIDANGIVGAYHVVQCVSGEDEYTVLEGFTITGGNANGTDSNSYGGGMYNYESDPTVTNCIFGGNSAEKGGGMYNSGSNPFLANCTFRGNKAGISGGGIYHSSSSGNLINCTFSGNHSAGTGGGMEYYNVLRMRMINCILWGDTPDEIHHNSLNSPLVIYSDVEGGTGESWFNEGCIDADPCFVNTKHLDRNQWNLRLKRDSPCIDAGATLEVYVPLDLDGNPRVLDDPNTPNTGPIAYGSLNAVDMGAYEFEPCRIPGDINCDGLVDFKDVAILCRNWLAGT